MSRRGAATDLMEQVGDALAAPRVASVAGEKSMWWSPEKDVRTKMQVSQVRGEEERGLVQHTTPTSRAGRGASGGCDPGPMCWTIPWS